jgi:hypothetical protein
MDNAAQVRDAVAAFGRGDIPALASTYFHPDIIWHVAGSSPVAGTYKGQEEVFGFFRTAIEQTGGTFKVTPHAVLGDDEHGVLLAETTATRPDGRKLEVGECLVIHMTEGKFAEVWHSQYDRDEWDSFWA